MLRLVGVALRLTSKCLGTATFGRFMIDRTSFALKQYQKCSFGIFSQNLSILSTLPKQNLLSPSNASLDCKPSLISQVNHMPVRTVTKFSLRKGKRKSVKAVIRRFYRLQWGMWIRTIAGRSSSVWRMSWRRRLKRRRHVFTNATQSYLLDKMVTQYWRRPHFYVDDPYNPYHKREEFKFTRKKPVDY